MQISRLADECRCVDVSTFRRVDVECNCVHRAADGSTKNEMQKSRSVIYYYINNLFKTKIIPPSPTTVRRRGGAGGGVEKHECRLKRQV